MCAPSRHALLVSLLNSVDEEVNRCQLMKAFISWILLWPIQEWVKVLNWWVGMDELIVSVVKFFFITLTACKPGSSVKWAKGSEVRTGRNYHLSCWSFIWSSNWKAVSAIKLCFHRKTEMVTNIEKVPVLKKMFLEELDFGKIICCLIDLTGMPLICHYQLGLPSVSHWEWAHGSDSCFLLW